MGGGLPHLGHHEAAEQAGGLVAEDALGHPDQADAAVEDLAHVEAGVGPADDLADEVAEQERPQLVHDRADDLGPVGLAHALIRGPEPAEADGVVGHRGDPGGAELLVGKDAGDVGQAGRGPGGRGVAEQGEAGGAEHVVGTGPQKAAKMDRKMPTRLSTARSGSGPERTFRTGAASGSSGSISTVRAAAASGSRSNRSVIRSPLGSITTTPRPASTSPRTRLVSSVDFPDPVAPMTWRW